MRFGLLKTPRWRDAGQQLLAVAEVAGKGSRADAGHARASAKVKPPRPFGDQIERRPVATLLQIAVMVARARRGAFLRQLM